MLAAARRLFAKNGYARTSIRAIAAEADVNHALVVTYFGGKEALFMEAVGRFQIPQDALVGDIEGMGARIARAYLERWENMAEDDPWLALVRSSLSHEGSYQLLRSELQAQQAAPLSHGPRPCGRRAAAQRDGGVPDRGDDHDPLHLPARAGPVPSRRRVRGRLRQLPAARHQRTRRHLG